MGSYGTLVTVLARSITCWVGLPAYTDAAVCDCVEAPGYAEVVRGSRLKIALAAPALPEGNAGSVLCLANGVGGPDGAVVIPPDGGVFGEFAAGGVFGGVFGGASFYEYMPNLIVYQASTR